MFLVLKLSYRYLSVLTFSLYRKPFCIIFSGCKHWMHITILFISIYSLLLILNRFYFYVFWIECLLNDHWIIYVGNNPVIEIHGWVCVEQSTTLDFWLIFSQWHTSFPRSQQTNCCLWIKNFISPKPCWYICLQIQGNMDFIDYFNQRQVYSHPITIVLQSLYCLFVWVIYFSLFPSLIQLLEMRISFWKVLSTFCQPTLTSWVAVSVFVIYFVLLIFW